MNFGLTEDQELLQSSVRRFLDTSCPLEEVRRIAATDETHSAEQWSQVSMLGWPGLIIPEEFGGTGLDWVDLMVVLMEAGRSLFPAPLIPTVLAASTILDAGNEDQHRHLLPGLADGTRIGSVGVLEASDIMGPTGIQLRGTRQGEEIILDGTKCFVSDPEVADLFVVPFRSGDGDLDLTLAVVHADADGVSVSSFPSMDQTKRQGDLVLEGVRIAPTDILGEVGSAWPAIERLLDRGAVAVAAETCGAAEALHQKCVQYAKDRVQFGSPIGRYQGVKHPLAEMYLEVESSKSLLYFAAWALSHQLDQASPAASRAKAYASEKFIRMGMDAIQIHGALGYTEECDVQLYFKRSKWARAAYGDPTFHFDRLMQLGGH